MIGESSRFGEEATLGRFIFFLRKNSLLPEGKQLLKLGGFL